ncbi:cytochrome c oxidase assembly protein [Thermopolyspora sp. NPDC052614]|uniref:cytochrome c oxidase assembly protein n=1 Tax=Thermopolyspora sp. NPDC052614 TaxID=3155682 RepID=UPI00342C4267
MVSSTSSVEQRAEGPAAGERPATGEDAGPETRATADATPEAAGAGGAGGAGGTAVRRRRVVVWAAAAVACGVGVLVPALWFGMSGPPRAIVDLPDAGPVVTWSLPVVRLLVNGFAMLTVGALLAGVALLPADGGRLGPTALRCVRAAGQWALWWAGCTALGLALTLADILGVPLSRLAAQEAVLELIGSFDQGRAALIVMVAAMAVAAAANRVATVRGGLALLGLAVFALLPPMYAGHSASSADHDLAVSSMMVHGVAVAVWVGGLVAILLYLRGAGEPLATALTRFSAVALACFAATGISGLVNVVGRFDDLGRLLTSRYGQLVMVKVLALAVLAAFGLAHRRRTIAALVEGRSRRPFLRLAAGEVLVMAATVGLAVALSRTPPPPGEGEASWVGLQLGYDLPPLTWERLVTEGRLDLVAVLALVAAGLAYAAGMRCLRRREGRWPATRALAWYAGLAVVAFAMLSGVGAYSRAMFSVHAIQHLVLTVLGPLLLALGAPLTLWARARSGEGRFSGGRTWTAHPLAVVAAYAVPMAAFYFTDLFTVAQWSHAGHLVSQVVFLGTGFLYFRLALEADPPAVPLGLGNRVRLLLAGLPAHMLITVALLDGPVVGENWYRRLGLMWAGSGAGGGIAAESVALATDQRIGAVISGLGALAVFTALLVALGLRGWAAKRGARG